MEDRFSKFPFSINDNFDQLCESCYSLMKLSIEEKENLSMAFKQHYLENLNNKSKTHELLKILNFGL